ncbi:MAG: hypothetical protein JWM14_2788 [Chitinophagaceae bacterium]|nr:hypothetical protein [Chitinophagaceae bacterium]
MTTPKIEVSVCCNAEIRYNYDDLNDIYFCKDCRQLCETHDICEYCLGTGEIDSYEYVYNSEPLMARVGNRRCMCQIPEEDDEPNEE